LNINVQIIYRLFDCSVVLLPFVVSLKVGSITGVTMSPGYGGYQSTTPPPCYTTTFAPTGYYTEGHNYYTTKAPEYYTITKDPEYYTEAPKYYHQFTGVLHVCCHSLYTEAPKYYSVPSYYTEAPTNFTTKAAEPSRPSTTPPRRLNRAVQVLHHQGSTVLHHNLCFPEPLHRSPEVLLCPKLHNYN
jgi:hypothetical protein